MKSETPANDIFDCPVCGGYGEKCCHLCGGTGKLSFVVALFLANRSIEEARAKINQLRKVMVYEQERIIALYSHQYKIESVMTIEVTKAHIRQGYIDSGDDVVTVALEEKFNNVIVCPAHAYVGHYGFTHKVKLPPKTLAFMEKSKKQMKPFKFNIRLQSILEDELKEIRDID